MLDMNISQWCFAEGTGSPQEFTGCVELFVDSPCAYTNIGTVPLKGLAGTVKLHTLKDLDVSDIPILHVV